MKQYFKVLFNTNQENAEVPEKLPNCIDKYFTQAMSKQVEINRESIRLWKMD